MGLVLQLVETGADTRRRGIEVLEIDRPRDLSDIANLGLTLPEAKQLLARVQQAVVAVQARNHAARRLIGLQVPRRANSTANSRSASRSPASVSTTDFALFTGS